MSLAPAATGVALSPMTRTWRLRSNIPTNTPPWPPSMPWPEWCRAVAPAHQLVSAAAGRRAAALERDEGRPAGLRSEITHCDRGRVRGGRRAVPAAAVRLDGPCDGIFGRRSVECWPALGVA